MTFLQKQTRGVGKCVPHEVIVTDDAPLPPPLEEGHQGVKRGRRGVPLEEGTPLPPPLGLQSEFRYLSVTSIILFMYLAMLERLSSPFPADTMDELCTVSTTKCFFFTSVILSCPCLLYRKSYSFQYNTL